MLGVTGDEFSSFQQLLREFRDAYYFDANGSLLDERAAQLPGDFTPRRGAQAARGGGVSLRRSDASLEEIYDPASIILTRSTSPDFTYFNTGTITFPAGTYTVTLNEFRCTTAGIEGNAPAGALDSLVSARGSIVEVISELPVISGYDREEDPDFRVRAELWVLALTRTTPDAIRAIALNFQGSDGTSLRGPVPLLWEDPETRGYCELIVDDGFGFVGQTQAAAETTGIFPSVSGTIRYQLPFEAPAVGPPTLNVGGTNYNQPHPDFMVIEERGLCIIRESPRYISITGGSTSWTLGGHYVLRGFLAELQAYIEVTCRAAGNRVRVLPPSVQEETISANVTVKAGYDIATVFDRVKRGIVSYITKLPPGQPLLFFRLSGDLVTIPGVRNVLFDQNDLYPATPRTKIVVYYGSITLR